MSAVRLGDYAKLIRGITFKPVDKCDPSDEGAVVCMRTKNVQVVLDASDLIAVPNSLIKNPEKMLSAGDILVSSANSWNLVGKCCQVPKLQHPSTAGGFISILRPKTKKLKSSYLYRWFSSDVVQRKLRSFANQTTNISNLDHKRTLELQIPLPSPTEQKRIAGILDVADALRIKRREALAQLDTLLQSIFLDMFGDPVTNPMGWAEEHLPNLVSKRKHSLKRGPFGGAVKKEIFVPDGFKVYEQKNVIRNDFNTGAYFIKASDYERLTAFRVQPNDLLISCSGTIGLIVVVPADASPGIMNQALLKITLDESRMLNAFFLGLWSGDPRDAAA